MCKKPESIIEHGRVTRRSFLHLMECLGAGAFLGWKPFSGRNQSPGPKKPWPPGSQGKLFPCFPGRVVHVHDEDATTWDFATGWYGYYVDQDVVDAMVEVGLKTLTQTDTAAAAWARLVPGYKPGQRFAIKVNFNNYFSTYPDPDPDINALIEPVNAVIRTLIQFGVAPEEITVYDVTHGWHNGGMPQISFIDRCLYPGVNFLAYLGNPDPYSATEFVTFHPPGFPGIPDLPICNALVESDYLINMPLPKEHSFTGVTLGFKNLMGSIDICNKLHSHFQHSYFYDPGYHPLIDLYKNPHFGGKAVLTVGDALFGNWEDTIGVPPPWITFGDGAPNSLLFSADIVAIDSVMTDFLEIERIQQGVGPVLKGTRDLFFLGETEGLGIHEKGDPWKRPKGSGYKRIDYIYIEGA